jgi:hypothetical protein
MRIVNVVEATQAQAQVQQRFIPPPSPSTPRRVQAINRQSGPDDTNDVGTSPPGDGISLALSPEGREAARQAAIDELLASQARRSEPVADAEPEPAKENPRENAKEDQAITELERRDREVRAHEQAHAAAAGDLGSAPTFTYQVGPDGRLYAVGGEVRIDTTPVTGDPAATLRKAQQIERAAFAPGDPSPEDLHAAVMAAAMAARARRELARQREDDRRGEAEAPAQQISRNG